MLNDIHWRLVTLCDNLQDGKGAVTSQGRKIELIQEDNQHAQKLYATHFKMSLKVDFIVYFVSCQFHTSYALLVNSMIMMMMKINIIVAIDMTSAMTAASYCVTQGSI